MNVDRQDAMTRERNLAAVPKGFAGRFAKRGSWLFIEGDVLSVQLFPSEKEKAHLCDRKDKLCYLSRSQVVGGGTSVEDSAA